MKTKRIFRIIVLVLVAIVLILQLIPNKLPENLGPGKDDIILTGTADAAIGDILRTSCYDCHSNEVTYPWYSYVAPVSWLVRNDVEEGRRELNFSEWATYKTKRMAKKLHEIEEEVEEGEMPMAIYTFIHGQAKLSEEQKEKLIAWSKQAGASLKPEVAAE